MTDHDWADLLDRQHGVVTRAQCQALGVTDEVAHRRLRRGLWVPMHSGVYLTAPGPVDLRARAWAALLAVGGPAAVSHETALHLAGFTISRSPLVHVAVIDGRRSPRRRGVRVHFVPDLGPGRILDGSPPRVRVEHTVVDLERLCRDSSALVSLVTGVVGAGLTTPERLAETLALRPRARWRRELGLMLNEVAAGAQSPLELEDLRNDRRHGLPTGQRQVLMVRGRRKDRVDVLYVGGPRRGVVKELDGRLGHEGEGGFRDMDRDCAAALRGHLALRLGWLDLFARPCRAAAMTGLVLQNEGIAAPLQPCGPGCRLARELPELEATRDAGWSRAS